MLHGSNAVRVIVQSQQLAHLGFNSATERIVPFLTRGLSIMATFVNTSASSNGLVDRLLASFPSLAKALQRRRLYAQTVFELNQLSDRELTDLGISRLSIYDLAREAAYSK
jgi:uncharacterized protein YjiS (DUF1127 family)